MIEQPKPIPGLPTPSHDQERAIQALSVADGVVKILTGRAGAGKSFIINHVQRRTPVTVCAMTGRAALLVKGTTAHRLFTYDSEKERSYNKKHLVKMMDNSEDIIVIDEASMLGRAFADFIYSVAQEFNKTIILVGDWAQASPVNDGWIFDSPLFQEAKIYHLNECHRQNDRDFIDALDDLRKGKKESPHYSVFQQCLKNEAGPHHVRLYATNKDTDAYNESRLTEVRTVNADVNMRAEYQDRRAQVLQDQYPAKPGAVKKAIEQARVFESGYLRLGARLMVTTNDITRSIVNGDTCTLLDVALPKARYIDKLMANTPAKAEMIAKAEVPEGMAWLSQISNVYDILPAGDVLGLLVELDRGGLVYIPKKVVELKDPAGCYAAVVGFPVDLAWAYTGHKAQGASLSHVWVSMSSIAKMKDGSKHGLAYVMLSRAVTPAGLVIDQWTPDVIVSDPIVKDLVL